MARRASTLRDSAVADNDFFAFSAEDLATLHNLKNPAAFMRFGGIEGLVNGLRSEKEKGIGGESTNRVSEPTPDEATSSPMLPKAVSIMVRRRSTLHEEDSKDITFFEQRKRAFQDNHLPTKKQLSFINRVWLTYNDPVLFLLTAAAIASLAIGLYQTFTTTHTASNPPVEWVEGVAIIIAIIIIVLAGSINDWQKSLQFKKLNEKQLERESKVIRFGVPKLIFSSDILVGDVVSLEPGDVMPADGILLSGQNITCDESSVTGESDLVVKTPGDEAFRVWTDRGTEPVNNTDLDLDPFVLSGTKVLEGVGTFLVTSTGLNSTYGKILSQLRDESDPTPLQGRLAVLAKYISRAGMLIFLLLFVALFIRFLVALPHNHSSPADKGKNFINILIIALTVLVIAVPEGLPLAVTLSLAFATKRMLKDHNLVRELKACETMGNATSICSDKTGTLTMNMMTVVAGAIGPTYRFNNKLGISPTHTISDDNLKRIELSSPKAFADGLNNDIKTILRQSIALNTTAFENKDGSSFVGSNTESALLNYARDYLGMGNVLKERSGEKIVQMIPFSGARKCMVTVVQRHDSPGTYRVLIKGAAETLLSKCTRIVHDPTLAATDIELAMEDRQLVTEIIRSYASEALRMIGFVYRDIKLPLGDASTACTDMTIEQLLQDSIFLGVMGIHDALRPGVPESVKDCQRAGVTVRMVTGDNLLTAKAIAEQCGILSRNVSDIAMEGSEFRSLGEFEIRKVVPDLKVLARSSPEDKQKLVLLLKEMGEVVAVTGDGTNDVSAMSAADVSFTMGLTGTEVARQASSIILMTDDFTSIVKAIKWGRTVNDSVKKFLQFQITITVTSVLLAFASSISNSDEQSVLTPVQLMWINLFQDTLAALALATDSPTPRVLNRKPERRNAPLITIQMWKTIVGQSIYQSAVTFVLYFAGPRIFPYHTDHQVKLVGTLVFNAYVWMQIFNIYNSRQYDDHLNIFEGIFHNWLFMTVSSLMIGLQVLIVFVGGQAFAVVPLTGTLWAISLVIGLLTLAIGALIRCIPNKPIEKIVEVFKSGCS